MAEIISFGNWVEWRRKRLGFTRKALAGAVGCSPVTIQKIERDERRPSLQIAHLLAQHLQIPAAEQDSFIRRARGEGMDFWKTAVSLLDELTELDWEGEAS